MRKFVLLFMLFTSPTWAQSDPWDMAAQISSDQTAVITWNIADQVDLLPLWNRALEIDRDSLPEERLNWDAMLEHLTLDLEEWLSYFNGSGTWTYSATTGSHEIHFGLNPNLRLAELLAEKFGGPSEPFLKSSGEESELRCDLDRFTLRLGASGRDKVTLAQDSRFLDARKRLGHYPCDILVYLSKKGSQTEYAVLTVDLSEKNALGFWKPDEAGTLPHPAGFKPKLLTSRPSGLPTLVAVDLKWLSAALSILRQGLPPGLEAFADFLAARDKPGGLLQTFIGQGLFATDQTPLAFLIGPAPVVSFYSVAQFQEQGRVEKFLHDLEYETRLQTLQGCEKNLEILSWEVARWEVDYKRKFPADLQELVPDLLSALPACPSAGRSTYAAAETEEEGRVVYCKGHHHPQTQPDYPRFTQLQGAQQGEFRPRADLPTFSREGPEGRADYYLSSGQRISVDAEAKLVYLADGPKDTSFLTVPAPSSPLPKLALENLEWAGDRVVYLDYFQLAPDLSRLSALTQNEYPDTVALLILAFLETVHQAETTEASNAFRREPDGISYRGAGLWGSPVLTTPVAGLSIWLQAVVRREETAKAEACRDNVLKLAQATEIYAQEHEGIFPDKLSELVPKYLPAIPHCPSAAVDTYSEGFINERFISYDPHSQYIIVRCLGHHHRGARWDENQPAYQTDVGVVPPLK